MSWKLYLDDMRPAPDGFTLATSVDEALALINDNGFPEEMSLDHDLGLLSPSGMYFVHWLVDQDMNGVVDLANVKVTYHSANPVGRRNMKALIDNYLEAKSHEVRNLPQTG